MNCTQVEVEITGTKDRKVCWVPAETHPKTGDQIVGGHKITRTFVTMPKHAIPKRHWTPSDFLPAEEIEVLVSKGSIKVTNIETGEVLYAENNVIVNGIRPLFARMLTSLAEPLSSVYGLALGAGGTGSTGWSANTQPDPTSQQTAMVSEIKRKPFNSVQYLDSNGNPTLEITNQIQFQTIFNATLDAITLPIREMGLIGGGTKSVSAGGPTDMLTAPYWDPAVANPNSVSLLTYKTLPPFILPAETNIAVQWQLSL